MLAGRRRSWRFWNPVGGRRRAFVWRTGSKVKRGLAGLRSGEGLSWPQCRLWEATGWTASCNRLLASSPSIAKPPTFNVRLKRNPRDAQDRMTEHAEASFLIPILIFCAGAVIAVPLFNRAGLGAVVGYLVAGIAIGPSGFKLFTDAHTVRAVAELGIVLLLFVIGLELKLSRLL